MKVHIRHPLDRARNQLKNYSPVTHVDVKQSDRSRLRNLKGRTKEKRVLDLRFTR